jgi:hypothetical protein
MNKLFLTAAFAGLCVFGQAQGPGGQQRHDSTEGSARSRIIPRSVTGCLKRGIEPGTYTISDSEGRTYQLRSGPSVRMNDHVGDRVTITGSPEESEWEQGGKQTSMGADRESNQSSLHVTSLSIVSAGCQP